MIENLEHHYNQRIPTSKKTDDWRKQVLNHLCMVADEFFSDWERMEANYALKNNQLDRDEYRQICKNLGSGVDSQLYINAYNKTPTIIDALLGEEWSRPFSFSIVNESPGVANRLYREKRREVDNLITTLFKIELDRHNKYLEIEMKKQSKLLKGQQLDEEQMAQAQAEIEAEYNRVYNSLPEIKDIMRKYDTMSTIEEITINKIMKMMVSRLNIKFLKNKTFEDALLAGLEACEVHITHDGLLPKIKPINPLNLFYEKSPDVDFIQYGDYAGYKEYLTISQILNDMGDLLSDDDYTQLTEVGIRNGIAGINHPFSTNKGYPSQWKEVERMGRFPSGRALTSEDYLTLDRKYGYPDKGFIGGRSVSSLGLSAVPTRRNHSELIEVYRVYWKSQRRLGILQFTNEYGELDETIVDEEFVIPKGAKKEKEIQNDMSTAKVYHCWYDSEDNYYRLRWVWVPEIWKGTRIGNDIYVAIGPLKHAYQSLIDPWKVKLPIHGYIYNNRNAFSIAPMDRMKPWQKIYYIIMSRMLKLITQDRGSWAAINSMLFDKELGVESTLQVAEDNGLLIYNPLSNAKGAGGMALGNTMKVMERIDLSNAQMVNYYIELLRFVEQNIMAAAGMSPQRIAQTNPRMTATDNYRETMHSVNMTEPLHVAHDLLWEEILQTLMEMTLSVLKGSSGVIRGLLNDDEKTILDLKHLDLEDNFNLKVGDNSKAFKILEQAKSLSHALVQNDKAGISHLISMMEMESLSELKTEMKQVEKEFDRKMEEQQSSQQAHEKELEAMRKEMQEDEQRAKLDEIYLRGVMDYNREKLKGTLVNMSFDMDKDRNLDNVPDYLQIGKLENDLIKNADEIAIKRKELELKEQQMMIDKELKEEEIASKERMSDEEKAHLARIEKAKIRIANAQKKR